MPRPSGHERIASRRRTVGSVVGGTLLNLAAVGGVVCIIAVIAAFAFNITLIMFKTGSMGPAIPAGSLAVVRQIPASEVRVGDVVTVERAGQLPVSHRVRSISPAGSDARSITLRGDANRSDDPEPYTVSHVRVVLLSVPGLAYPIVALSRPLVLGSVTLGAAVLVTWAFWPGGGERPSNSRDRRHRSDTRRGPRHRKGSARENVTTANTAAHTSTANTAAHTSTATTTFASLAVLPLALTFAQAPPMITNATETVTVVHGRYLTLTSIGDTNAMRHLVPHRPVLWQVGVEAHPPETSVVNIGISAQGGLAGPGGLQVGIRACTVRWVNAGCAGSKSLWLPRQELAAAVVPVDAYGARALGAMMSTERRWLLVEATLPADTPPDTTAEVRLHAWGAGGEVGVGGSTGAGLATTGTPFGPAIILALATVLSGIALAGLARRWRPLAGQLP